MSPVRLPLALVALAVPMSPVRLPLALVALAVRVGQHALALLHVCDPVALVLVAVREDVHAICTVHLGVLPRAGVARAVRVLVGAHALHLAVNPIAFESL